jgi:hypothetical protein
MKKFKNMNEYANILVNTTLPEMIVDIVEINVSTDDKIEIIIKGYRTEKKE